MNQLSVSATHENDPLFTIKNVDRPKRKNASWKKRLWATVILIIVCVFSLPSMLSFAGNAWIDQKKLQQVEKAASGSYVTLDEMPDYLWQSFVAIEDHRYWKHHGVDYIAFARAIWADVQAGSYVQGGSTITMQLARNLFLTQDKTILRKAKEIAIAYQLEQRYSKKELLEMYLNVIYFGHGQYGIESASQLYFGKRVNGADPSVISLGESAILASLPKAPEAYSPLKHWEKAMERQAVVLGRMVEQGLITQEQKQAAQEEATSKKKTFARAI